MAAESSNEESSKISRQFLQEIIEEYREYFYGSFGVADVNTLVQRFLAETDLQQDILLHLGYGPKTKIQHHCKVLSESIGGGAEIPPLPPSTLAPDSGSVHYLAASLSKLSRGESINNVCDFLSNASRFHRVESVQMAGPCQPFLRLNETTFDTSTHEKIPTTSSSESTPTSSCGDAWYALAKTPQALIICYKYTGKADSVLMSLGALFCNLSPTHYAIPTPPNFECLPIVLCQIVDPQDSSSQNISPLLIQGVLNSLPDTYSDPDMSLLLPCQWNESEQDPSSNIRPVGWTVTPTQLVASTITPERVYARADPSGNKLEATLTVCGNFLSNIKSITTTGTVFVDSSWRLVHHTDQMIQLSVNIYSFDSLKNLTLRFDSFDCITTGPFTLPPENVFSTNASLGYLLTDQVDKSLFTRAVVVFAKQLYQLKVKNPNFHSLPDDCLPPLFVQFVKADEIAGGKRMRSDILDIVKNATEFDSLLETIEDCVASTYERILRFANQWPAISKTWGSIMFLLPRIYWEEAEMKQNLVGYLKSITYYTIIPYSLLCHLLIHTVLKFKEYFLETPDSGYSALLDFLLFLQIESDTQRLLAQRKLTDPGSLCRAKYLLSLIQQNSKLDQPFQKYLSIPQWYTFNSKNRVAQSLDMIKCISTIQEDLLHYIQVVVIGFQDAGKSSLLEGMFELNLGSSSTQSTTTISIVKEYEIGPCTISISDTPGLNDLAKTVRAIGKQAIGRASIYLLVISAAELDRPNSDHVAAVQQLSGCTSLDYVLVFLTKIDFQDRTTESLNRLVDRYSDELKVPRQNFCLTSMAHQARADNHANCLKLSVCDGKKAKSWLLRQLCRFGLIPKECVDNLELQSPLPLHVASASSSPLPPSSSSSSSSSSSFSPPGPSSPSSSSSSPASPVPYELTSHIRSRIEGVDVNSIVQADFPHPFFTGERLSSFKVLKIFLDGASRPRLLELSDLSKVLYKNSDDLRLDKFVLTMMRHFNECWEQEQLRYKWHDGHAGSLLRSITYQVQPLGTKGGFIQFISNSHSVLPLYNRSLLGGSRNYNDWKFDEHGNLLATAAAAYLSLFILNVGDTHQSNMLLTDRNELVAIDFAFLHESPLVDTSYFPIPVGLKELMRTQNQWEAFKSLCWRGLQALKKHSEELIILCRTAAKAVDPRLLADAPRHLHYSLNYSREELFSSIEKGTRLAIPKNILQILK